MWQFERVSILRRVGWLCCIGLLMTAEASLAQPPDPSRVAGPRSGRGGGTSEPSLNRELRSEPFFEKMKITAEQKEELSEIERDRREYFRSLGPVLRSGDPPSEEVVARIREFETRASNVLTGEQKEIWEDRKAEIKREMAMRDTARISRSTTTGTARPEIFGMNEPSLSRELRFEEFALKVKLTDEQKKQINDIDVQRREFFRTELTAGARTGASTEKIAAKMKEFEASSVDVLTPPQKVLWEAQKAELSQNRPTREPNLPARVEQQPQQPSSSDRDRIFALEQEVRSLRAEILKLKSALATPAPKP